MSASTSTSTTDIRIERVLQATIDRVYDAWTKPELLTRWYCPNPELELKVDADIRPAGPGHGATEDSPRSHCCIWGGDYLLQPAPRFPITTVGR